MKIDRIHHVAYRCRDAKETMLWYRNLLNMDFELAFFELPTQPPMGRDPNTPDWAQHIAFKVKDRAELLEFKAHLESNGVEVLGVTDHGAFHSIYFFDRNGHRLELACPDPDEAAMLAKLAAVKWDMLEEWSKTRRAAFLHEREFRQ